MKANRLGWYLVFLLVSAVFHSPAQQSEADRKLLADIRTNAERGDAQSQDQLARVFHEGSLGVATNYVEAVKWFRRAAEQNYAKAQCNLGFCYQFGQGVAKDPVEAVKWFRQAAQQNSELSQYCLGVCYRDGLGVPKDPVEAVKLFRQAAEQNHAKAQQGLGVCYANGQGVAKDPVEAVKWYRQAAEQGLVAAQHNLGVCYHDGQGVATNYVEAVKWFRRAAQQNSALSQYCLGLCYQEGQGVATNYEEAVKWFRQAAEQGLAVAQLNLGVSYVTGEGAANDEVEAYKWFLLAAAQGLGKAREAVPTVERQLTRAQLAKGQKLASAFKPREVPTLDDQPSEADGQLLVDLRAKAAIGDAQAQNELGEALYAGKPAVVKNPVEAVKWFRKAAEQNLPAAQCNLGICYERGHGVAKYEVEAYKWDYLAAAQGDTKAKRNASLLELLLSPEEIAEGKLWAQAWLEQRKKAPAVER